VAVVDPGVGTARAIAMVETAGHLFLAPDNGLLAEVLSAAPQSRLWHLSSDALATLGPLRPSATFHGRDIFAPMAARLASGRLAPSMLGIPVNSLVPGWSEEPRVERERVSGVVITIDHFGNLITNIDQQFLRGFVNPQVHAGLHVLPLRRTYGDVRPGEVTALVNSFGVVEVAVAEGRATDLLGLSRGAPVSVRDGVRRR